MSVNLDPIRVEQFDSEVKHAYQGFAKLRECVRMRAGVKGYQSHFEKYGKGLASQHVPQAEVTLMGISATRATATLVAYDADEMTDIFKQEEILVDEQRALVKTIAGAMGRREDQIIIDALEAASTSLTIASSVGGSTGWDVDKVHRARRLLADQGIEEDDMQDPLTMVSSYRGREQALGQTEVGSTDYNNLRAHVTGEIGSFGGFRHKWMGSRDEGGLDLTGTDRTSFAFAHSAIGMAVGHDIDTDVNYIPQRKSHLSSGNYRAGAVAIDAAGIVEITTVES